MHTVLAGLAKELATLLEMTFTVSEMKTVFPEAIQKLHQARDLLTASGETVPGEVDHLIERIKSEL